MTRSTRLLGLALAAFAAVSTGEGGARSQDARDKSGKPASTAPSSAGRSPELDAAVRSLVNDRTLKDAQIGIVVMDCETGNVLAQSGEHQVLNPASNAKLYTAAAALAILHGSHRYQTTLSGTIQEGGVSGLTLRGHGDPSLRTDDLWRLVQEMKHRGVRRVDGDLFVDQKFFDELTTPRCFISWTRRHRSSVRSDGSPCPRSVRPETPPS